MSAERKVTTNERQEINFEKKKIEHIISTFYRI